MLKYFIIFALSVLSDGQLTSPRSNDVEEIKCTTKEGLEGLCVPYYQCSDDNVVIDDGSGILTSRFGEDCNLNLQVCCGDGDVSVTAINRTVSKPLARLNGCGVRNVNGIDVKISNAKLENSQFGEFPWMVAILREEEVSAVKIKVYKCGGALIHWKAVLTAGHCVVDKNKRLIEGLMARAGEWDTQIKTETIPHQDRRIVSIKMHENYGSANLFNDIALLIMESEFTPATSIDLICLPSIGLHVDRTKCVVTGWGKNEFGRDGRFQVVMKKVELPTMDREQCQRSLRRTRLGPRFKLNRSFICAGGESGIDTCTGDGGSPLVCPIPGQVGRYELIGLVSWGIGCGDNGIPGVYVNIPALMEWINDELFYADIENIKEVNKY